MCLAHDFWRTIFCIECWLRPSPSRAFDLVVTKSNFLFIQTSIGAFRYENRSQLYKRIPNSKRRRQVFWNNLKFLTIVAIALCGVLFKWKYEKLQLSTQTVAVTSRIRFASNVFELFCFLFPFFSPLSNMFNFWEGWKTLTGILIKSLANFPTTHPSDAFNIYFTLYSTQNAAIATIFKQISEWIGYFDCVHA